MWCIAPSATLSKISENKEVAQKRATHREVVVGEKVSLEELGGVRYLADLVDRRMREVAEHVKGDTARIAILVALNLADELSQVQMLQKGQEGERVEIREKVAALTEELTHALEG